MRSVVEDTGLGRIILLKNNPDWNWFSMAQEGLEHCPSKCTIINSFENFNINFASAVIFYATNYPKDLPIKKVGQVWIYFTLESPYFSQDTQFRNIEWRDKINWTMTYRRDSDIWYPYGRVSTRDSPANIDYLPAARNKTKQVAWFVSHCTTPSRRQNYVKELRKYISVDTYGACGDLRCLPEGSTKCFDMLSRHYKFYLSFESAFCRDYVTEKVFEFVLKADIVPVVRGGADYSKYLPPKSYINTADFPSARHLGEYLSFLDSNDAAYSEYLQWKNHYYVQEKPIPICEICVKLTEPKSYANVYKDVFSWWHRDVCVAPNRTLS
ncbi:glycoprotein 3-alpha-L-fucosyltransferase A-like [Gigantopelta aegis]|uniref:glycoprotein 3-alpha-L-fucosyltransferase A-like n=1 Tax=Gigantopelta aegis TaxID=1735272 RepID=UPI001B88BACB|nr:glycoprotein 3-alpha-L-fucosyltransferase A-like [Gigantopelta aegis]